MGEDPKTINLRALLPEERAALKRRAYAIS